MASAQAQEDEYREAHGTPGGGQFEERETLRLELDTVYEGYIIEGYQSGIQGKYGENTAVRLTSPSGEKVTTWFNGLMEKQYVEFIQRLEKQEVELPVKVSFAQSKVMSETSGREYNKLIIRLDAHGEEVQFELDSYWSAL